MTITAGDVAAWADLTLDEAGEARMDTVVGAVLAHVEAHYAEGMVDEPDARLALVMQCARLYGRKDTPDGITDAVGGFGPLRVSKFDPDVRLLLSRFELFGFA